MIGSDVTPLDAICARDCRAGSDSVIVRTGRPGASWRSAIHESTRSTGGPYTAPRVGFTVVNDWGKHPIGFDDRRASSTSVCLFPFALQSHQQFPP